MIVCQARDKRVDDRVEYAVPAKKREKWAHHQGTDRQALAKVTDGQGPGEQQSAGDQIEPQHISSAIELGERNEWDCHDEVSSNPRCFHDTLDAAERFLNRVNLAKRFGDPRIGRNDGGVVDCVVVVTESALYDADEWQLVQAPREVDQRDQGQSCSDGLWGFRLQLIAAIVAVSLPVETRACSRLFIVCHDFNDDLVSLLDSRTPH